MDHHQGVRESCPSWSHSPFHKSQGGSPARNPSPGLSPSMDSHREMQFPGCSTSSHSVQYWPGLIAINALWRILWRRDGRYFTFTDWLKLHSFCKPFPKVQQWYFAPLHPAVRIIYVECAFPPFKCFFLACQACTLLLAKSNQTCRKKNFWRMCGVFGWSTNEQMFPQNNRVLWWMSRGKALAPGQLDALDVLQCKSHRCSRTAGKMTAGMWVNPWNAESGRFLLREIIGMAGCGISGIICVGLTATLNWQRLAFWSKLTNVRFNVRQKNACKKFQTWAFEDELSKSMLFGNSKMPFFWLVITLFLNFLFWKRVVKNYEISLSPYPSKVEKPRISSSTPC